MAFNTGDGPFDNLDGGSLIAKLCLTLCDPMDSSPLGSSVHGISQTKTLEEGCHFFLQRHCSQIPYLNLGGYILELGFGKGKSGAERSYSMSEVRGGGREEQLHIQGAVAARVQEGLEELLHIQGQEGQRRGDTPHPR